jgi:transposase
MASAQKGAEAQQQTRLLLDASGVYPLPSGVRTSAPRGQTPLRREWWTRAQLSAIAALAPAGKVYCYSQDGAITSAAVVAFLDHLRRQVPGRMGIVWDGSPSHRRHTMKECRAHGAAPRLHRERLPADAPELNPAEGLWHQRKGGDLRKVCCFTVPPRRRELREAGTRGRRTPHLLQRVFHGATLEPFMLGSVTLS